VGTSAINILWKQEAKRFISVCGKIT